MTPRQKKIAQWVGYPLFYLFCLLVFLYLTFPYDTLRDRITAEFNARQAADGTRLEIDDMSAYWLSGVEAEGVRLITPPPPQTEDEDPSEDGKKKKPPKPRVLSIDEAHARLGIFALLTGTTSVSFGAELDEGEISGYSSSSDELSEFAATLENISVGSLPMLEEMVELPMTGMVNGSIEMKLPEGKLSEADGTIELTIESLTVGDGKAKIRNTIALPKLQVGTVKLEAEVVKGRLDIKEMSAKGKDLELVADGGIRLRDPFDSSLVEMNLRFKFSDAYKNKNDMTRGLFGAPGSTVPGVFDLDPKIKRAKRPDGFYAWRLSGPMAHLNFEPAALAGGGARGRPSRPGRR